MLRKQRTKNSDGFQNTKEKGPIIRSTGSSLGG